MKKIILFFALLTCFVSCAQINKTIIKAQGFYIIPIPGTIPVDENGTPIPIQRDTVYTLFIEVNGQAPAWKQAWIGSHVFIMTAMPQKENTVQIGQEVMTNKPINFIAKKGNKIWQLALSSSDTTTKPPQFIHRGEILLSGKLKGKKFYFKIPTLTQLASPMYQ